MSGSDADGRLIARFLERRDEGAFDALYDRHTPRVYGLALRLAGGAEADARDLVQETWVRAVSGLGRFRGDARLSSWLCAICTNVWREGLRRTHREVDLEGAPEPVAPGSRLGALPPHEPVDVQRALDGLAPGYRAVVVLYGVYGFSHAEVADMLGISEGTSKSQLLRGRRALLRALNDEQGDES